MGVMRIYLGVLNLKKFGSPERGSCRQMETSLSPFHLKTMTSFKQPILQMKPEGLTFFSSGRRPLPAASVCGSD